MPALLISCSAPVDTELAERAAADFHDHYNKASYRVIHDKADQDFKTFISQEKFTRVLKKLRAQLGRYKSSRLMSKSSDTSIWGGTTVTLTYDTAYENDSQAKENFTFKVSNSSARLYNFNVSSKILTQ